MKLVCILTTITKKATKNEKYDLEGEGRKIIVILCSENEYISA